MERKDLLQMPDYWITQIQMAIYNCAMDFMKETDKNRSQLAEYLGVSKGYITQLLSGDYNYSLSKLVETSMAFGYIPKVNFIPIEEEIYMDEHRSTFILTSFESPNKFECFNSDNYTAA